MPRRPSPDSLKSYSLKAVAKHLEILSYGCEKGSPELRDLIDTEYFLQIKGDLKGDSFQAIYTLQLVFPQYKNIPIIYYYFRTFI